ncbi:MAG: hypothetical protein V1494_00065 [Candidatus Diapherotrites archaeon]
MGRNRIYFDNPKDRSEFFDSLRKASGACSWRGLAEKFGLGRGHFQRYQYGQATMPLERFNLFLASLPKEKQAFFIGKISARPDNWGAVKGGVNNLKRNRTQILLRLDKVRQTARAKRESTPVDLSLPLSAELCELIGAIIGDGCIDGYVGKNGTSKYHINITGHSELDRAYLTSNISSIVNALFEVNPKAYFRNDSKTIVLNIYSKQIFLLLTKRFGFPAGVKTYSVKIPEEIVNSCAEFIELYAPVGQNTGGSEPKRRAHR